MVRSRKEHNLQAICVRWFRLKYKPERAIIFAIPNGGSRNEREGANLKREGVTAGAPDLLIVHAGGTIFIEMKTEERGSRQSQAQKEFQRVLEGLGKKYFVIRSFNEFMNVVNGEIL